MFTYLIFLIFLNFVFWLPFPIQRCSTKLSYNKSDKFFMISVILFLFRRKNNWWKFLVGVNFSRLKLLVEEKYWSPLETISYFSPGFFTDKVYGSLFYPAAAESQCLMEITWDYYFTSLAFFIGFSSALVITKIY